MFRFILLCTVIFGLASANPFAEFSGDFEPINPLVVNGTDADIYEFPYIVSLRFEDKHNCGGTILSPDWILTAAHCVEGGAQLSDFSIQYGSTKISPSSENVVGVSKIIMHEEYDPVELQNDIAVLKLSSPIDMGESENRVRLPIPNQYFPTGTPAILAGWGRNETYGPIQEILQKVHYMIFEARDCQKLHDGKIFETNICAGVWGGWKGQCGGDSGGPLFVNGVQVGIVSWSGRPCTAPPYPGVFTGITNYIDWIQERTGLVFDLNFFLRSKL